ncbi:MAG: DoxX family protein [Candidatus Omnitrophota bacterium]
MKANVGDKYRDAGLLILRVGLGIMFIIHGWPKILAGPEQWAGLGKAMANLGITFAPAFWGFMAAFSEMVGGICLITGFMLKSACVLLSVTMTVAAIFHFKNGDGFAGASHAIELGIVFLSFILIGAGKYSLSLKKKKKKDSKGK